MELRFVIFCALIGLMASEPQQWNPIGKKNETSKYRPGKYLELVLSDGCKSDALQCVCGENNNYLCGVGEFCVVPKGYREPKRLVYEENF